MIIGLTGGIASGKSTVSKMLKKRGLPIVDADEIAREVVQAGSTVLAEIAKQFGDEVIAADGELDRTKLGTIIFADEEKRKQLNAIMHPAIRAEMLSQKERHISNGAKTVIMDIPLLFESKLQSYVEKIIVVTVSEQTQIERLMARNNFSEKEALARIQSQMPLKEKGAKADAVINNNGTIEETEKQVIQLLKKWNIKYSNKSE